MVIKLADLSKRERDMAEAIYHVLAVSEDGDMEDIDFQQLRDAIRDVDFVQDQTIRIDISGMKIQDVDNVPPNTRVFVRDYDVDDPDADDVYTDENGKPYISYEV